MRIRESHDLSTPRRSPLAFFKHVAKTLKIKVKRNASLLGRRSAGRVLSL